MLDKVKPKNESGKKYKFPYTIKYVTSGPEIDEEVKHKVIISPKFYLNL